MSNAHRLELKSRLLALGLLIYSLCFFIIAPRKGDLDLIRIPAFSLLLLLLVQVIFPRFRFPKSANLIAILVILGFPLAHNFLPS